MLLEHFAFGGSFFEHGHAQSQEHGLGLVDIDRVASGAKKAFLFKRCQFVIQGQHNVAVSNVLKPFNRASQCCLFYIFFSS